MVMLLFLLSGTLSCQQDGQEKYDNSLLQQIAEDPDYDQWREVCDERAYHVARGAFDYEKLTEILERNPAKNTCEIDKGIFSAIRGGVLYQEIDCKMVTLLRKLETKYSLSVMSDDQLDEIRNLYRSAHPEREAELRDKIIQLKTNK